MGYPSLPPARVLPAHPALCPPYARYMPGCGPFWLRFCYILVDSRLIPEPKNCLLYIRYRALSAAQSGLLRNCNILLIPECVLDRDSVTFWWVSERESQESTGPEWAVWETVDSVGEIPVTFDKCHIPDPA